MGKVREFMSIDPVLVDPDLSLRNLVDLLAREHISGVPVVAGRRVVGVVTMDDVVGFLASQPTVPAASQETVEQGETEPVDQWEEGDESVSAFFVEEWADAGADVAERFATVTAPEWDLLGEHPVEEVMSRRLLTVTPDSSIAEAARIMEREKVHRLLVMDGESLHGILSTSDVTRAVAESRA